MFLIAAAILIATGLIWVFTADASLASWNQPKASEELTKDDGMEVLKKSPENERKNEDGIENAQKN